MVPEDLPKLVIAVETETVQAVVGLVGAAIEAANPNTPEHAEAARGILVDIQKLKNRIEKERKLAQAPFKNISDRIMEAAKGATAPLEQAQGLVKQGLEQYLRHQLEAAAHQQQQIAAAHALAPPEGRQTPTLAVIPPPQRIAALSTYEVWDINITDEAQVPRQYLTVDMEKVLGAVKMGAQIPGVSAAKITKVAAR
jgi:hypothetical protein